MKLEALKELCDKFNSTTTAPLWAVRHPDDARLLAELAHVVPKLIAVAEAAKVLINSESDEAALVPASDLADALAALEAE